MNINKIINEYREYIEKQIKQRNQLIERAVNMSNISCEDSISLDTEKIGNNITLFTFVNLEDYTLEFSVSVDESFGVKTAYFEHVSESYDIPEDVFYIAGNQYKGVTTGDSEVVDIQELIEQDCSKCEELLTIYCRNIEFLNPDINDCDSPLFDYSPLLD